MEKENDWIYELTLVRKQKHSTHPVILEMNWSASEAGKLNNNKVGADILSAIERDYNDNHK